MCICVYCICKSKMRCNSDTDCMRVVLQIEVSVFRFKPLDIRQNIIKNNNHNQTQPLYSMTYPVPNMNQTMCVCSIVLVSWHQTDLDVRSVPGLHILPWQTKHWKPLRKYQYGLLILASSSASATSFQFLMYDAHWTWLYCNLHVHYLSNENNRDIFKRI